MKVFVLLAIVVSVAACTGSNNAGTEYSDPQPAPAVDPAPQTGVNISGYARVGVQKG